MKFTIKETYKKNKVIIFFGGQTCGGGGDSSNRFINIISRLFDRCVPNFTYRVPIRP